MTLQDVRQILEFWVLGSLLINGHGQQTACCELEVSLDSRLPVEILRPCRPLLPGYDADDEQTLPVFHSFRLIANKEGNSLIPGSQLG